MNKEQMNIVIVGHVDHGKSTVIGRLLADTGSLPQGKLEQVKALCAKTAKPFEYAFLLDALKDEQAQGITIDAARCFFHTKSRDYIIIDAPGHIEFLKNMVTGAARAEAALLVIDIGEGIRENSKRHGYMVSMLGIRQVVVLVNKMDLVNYDKDAFEKIQKEYTEFLSKLNVTPVNFIPISAFHGDNLVTLSKKTPWYSGLTVVEQLDHLKKKAVPVNLPLRLPVQDIYKFTEQGDTRRIVAGTIESGQLRAGDDVVFLPSRKRSRIASVERFNVTARDEAAAGEAVGVTLTSQIYIKPGELMVRASEPQPKVAARFKANIFWVGKAPMIRNKTYKLKIAAARASVRLAEIVNILDASELSFEKGKGQVDRHDVAECIFETIKPVAFDVAVEIETTSRFVIVDNYEIAGGGIVLEAIGAEEGALKEYVQARDKAWEHGEIGTVEREAVYRHRSKFIVFTGPPHCGKRAVAKSLEWRLFMDGYSAYYLGLANMSRGLDADVYDPQANTDELVRRLGELAHIMTDAGLIFITTIHDADDYDLENLKVLSAPHEILVVNMGDNNFNRFTPDLAFAANEDPEGAVEKIYRFLQQKEIIEYCI